MRTIKFRGKRLDNGKWIEGCFAEFVHPIDGDTKPGIQVTRCVPSSIDRFMPVYETELVEVIPESVGQWTGLVDRHGKEIFEGDICKLIILPVEEKVNPIKALLYVIQWDNACWGFKPLFPDIVNPDDKEWCPFWDDESGEMWCERYFEIVGNLIDSPELMEVE